VLSGIALGAFHYVLKPKPSERDLQNVAQGMSSRIKWRGQIAPNIDLKTTRGDTFRLSDNIGKKIVVEDRCAQLLRHLVPALPGGDARVKSILQ
jgi:hypothetical protein